MLVAAAGWTLEEPLHSLFVRYPTQRPLPCPEVCDDSEAAFRRILPPGISAEAAKLLLGAVLGCFIPRNFAASFSYPVILLTGEAGSGKSTLAKLIKTLIDNEVTTAAAKPRSVDDLFVDAQAAHLVSYDNMDFVRGNLSDAICQLTTGSAISKRKLYTNADRAILRAHGPVMLNGINPDIPKSDLIDRSVNIHLARITDYNPDAANRTDADLPLVMGHICDLLARALRNYAATEVSDAPRLALVAKVAAAAEPFGCSTPFVDLLRSNQQEALVSSQDNDLVTAALFALLTRNTTWTGTYKHLLETLTASAGDATCRSPEWPASPRKLAHHMREHAQLLRAQGIDFANGPKKEAGRIVTVRRLPDASADNLDIPF